MMWSCRPSPSKSIASDGCAAAVARGSRQTHRHAIHNALPGVNMRRRIPFPIREYTRRAPGYRTVIRHCWSDGAGASRPVPSLIVRSPLFLLRDHQPLDLVVGGLRDDLLRHQLILLRIWPAGDDLVGVGVADSRK